MAHDRAQRRHAHRSADRFWQNPFRVHGLHRPLVPRSRSVSLGRCRPGRNSGRLCLAAKGARRRHQEEPRRAARRNRNDCERVRQRCAGHSRWRSQRRHDSESARFHVEAPAAVVDYNARVVVPDDYRRAESRDPARCPHGDRRRNSCCCPGQARFASRAFTRTARSTLRYAADSDRFVRNPATDRNNFAVARRSWRGAIQCRLVARLSGGRLRAPAHARSCGRASGKRSRSGGFGRADGRGARPNRQPRRPTHHDAGLR